MLFLSYAEEDKERAREIAEWLRSQDFDFYDWRDPQRPGGRFIEQIEEAIMNADSFLALLSPSFLNSSWCRDERHLAQQRERDIQVRQPKRVFVHVLQIRTTPVSETGFLRNYDWADLTSQENKDVALAELASRLWPGGKPRPRGAKAPSLVSPLFRNRRDELERVLRGLNNAAGPHFWLVIAPPQLGKTWFLQRVGDDAAASETADWVTSLVDLRAQPAEVLGDVAALLACLFRLTSPTTTVAEALLTIAREISRSGQPYLCLLDSAEVLTAETAATLRSCLGQIYRLVQDAGQDSVRLALVVASRQEDQWRGVTPDPRLYPLPLTEFKADVVQQALHDLALEMKRNISPASAEFRKNAARVHRLTEGLPALLVRCLQWIEAQGWVGMERLESQDLFEKLTDPYIQEGLLTPDSLLPGGREQADMPLHALEQAYRILVPYRLFTRSHLKHHLESDLAFSTALESQGWSMEDLWKAISGTALLSRPLNEPWQEIQAAIRRLLHRYYYKSDDHRAEAHSEARKFVEVWADSQSGMEQVIGLVECLWHEATVLRLREPAEMEQRLIQSARTLSLALRPSTAYTLDELRDYASVRMRNDEEFQEAVSNVGGLFTRLVDIVVKPQ